MKIRRRKYDHGKEGWQLDLGKINGKRVQRAFSTRDAAERFAGKMKVERQKFGDVAASMTHMDRLRYAHAEVALRTAGVTLDEAVKLAVDRAGAIRERLALPELVERFVADRERMNKRERYVKQLKVSLGSLARRYPELPAPDLTRENIATWLGSNLWAPKTQNNYRGDVATLFHWAIRERYAQTNPAAGIEAAADEDREVSVLTPEQCERLLTTALHHVGKKFDREAKAYREAHPFRALLGYLALATFAGVRPEEVQRSPRTIIDVEHATAVITAARAKTRQRRVVDLPENAVAWLKLWMTLCPDQETMTPKNFRKLWEALREAAQLKPPGWSARRGAANREKTGPPWPKDVLRHTFATMHYALHQDRSRLQALLGHTLHEDTLFRHYRAVTMPDGATVNRTIAQRFFAILPPAQYLTTPVSSSEVSVFDLVQGRALDAAVVSLVGRDETNRIFR
jgi:site-specific recombinase XerD